MQNLNYYDILEIDQQAMPEEIKQAFRRLAKRYHPDKNPGSEGFAEQMFRQVCIAYETLKDTERKLRYDLRLKRIEETQQFHDAYLQRLRKAQHIRQKYELMFHELLNRNYGSGIRIYEQLQRNNPKFRIDDFLSYADSRDCEFLIAEAYQKLGDYQTAMPIYESLILYETRRPFFRHFTGEIKNRLKKIYFHYLMHPRHPEDIPNDLEKIRALNLSKPDIATVYKKLAEFYLEINRVGNAKKMLKMAFELHPRMAGAKRICQKLDMEYLLFQNQNLKVSKPNA
jgi:curved DNA-binding protein CbpA